MEFYLVVLHSAERSEARQWIVSTTSVVLQSTVVLQSGYDTEVYNPSISETLLDEAIDFARVFCDITEDIKNMIRTCRKSILYGRDSQPWTKKKSNFDATMVSLDGAEISELIGLFMLNETKTTSATSAQQITGFTGTTILSCCQNVQVLNVRR